MVKSLVDSNSYLKNAEKREKALERTVRTSSAIEGIHVTRDAETGRFVAEGKIKARPKRAKTWR